MAIIAMESFAGIAAAGDLGADWYSDYVTADAGRHSGGRSILLATDRDLHYYIPTASQSDYVGVSWAFKQSGGYFNYDLVWFWSSAGYEIGITANPTNGQITLYRRTTSIASTSTGTWTNATSWNHFEFAVYLNDTVGTAKLWLNGELVIDFSGDTKFSGSTFTEIRWGENAGYGTDGMAGYHTDLVIYDDTGSYNNTAPIGDTYVYALLPDGNGNYSQFVGSDSDSTNNYLLVDDPITASPDTDDYVGSGTVGNKDTYTTEDYSGGGTILGVQHDLVVAKTDAGAISIRSVVRSGSTDDVGSDLTLSTTYTRHVRVLEEDPGLATPGPWTSTNLNAVEIGAEVRS